MMMSMCMFLLQRFGLDWGKGASASTQFAMSSRKKNNISHTTFLFPPILNLSQSKIHLTRKTCLSLVHIERHKKNTCDQIERDLARVGGVACDIRSCLKKQSRQRSNYLLSASFCQPAIAPLCLGHEQQKIIQHLIANLAPNKCSYGNHASTRSRRFLATLLNNVKQTK
ncbi:MAG: hypothetical protein J3R72DRAFT_191333 [Linnemannia gamsii]|nr:MAG: hypothetical protein J3R72DRAFT_191333 [Linnemannia gamsii]